MRLTKLKGEATQFVKQPQLNANNMVMSKIFAPGTQKKDTRVLSQLGNPNL